MSRITEGYDIITLLKSAQGRQFRNYRLIDERWLILIKPSIMNKVARLRQCPGAAKDREIMKLLQQDSSLSVGDIARKVGLSVTPCWRRIQRLEEAGIIRGRVALLDKDKLGLGMTVFVALKTDQHNAEWLEEFAQKISSYPEVVEFYRMSGEVDYLLRVVGKDMAAYDRFYKRLISEVSLTDVSSSFAMEEIKYTTALPLESQPEH